MDNNMLSVHGKTIDNKLVVSGVYDFYQTYGLPLDLICIELDKHNMIPAWDVFYLDAIKAGVSSKKIITRIFEVVPTMSKNAKH